MGSGTTVVEAIINNRIGIGTDINPIAHLVAKVKTTPIHPKKLETYLNDLYLQVVNFNNLSLFPTISSSEVILPKHERIDFWFKPEQKEKLALLLTAIEQIADNDCRDFFLVCFAQILKSCSIWLQKSVKPTRDFTKNNIDPIKKFFENVFKFHFFFITKIYSVG